VPNPLQPLDLFPPRRLCPRDQSLRALKRALVRLALFRVRSDFKLVKVVFVMFPELRNL
jgi:hypothetical protein